MEANLTGLEASIKELKEAIKARGLDNVVGRLSRVDYVNLKAIAEKRTEWFKPLAFTL